MRDMFGGTGKISGLLLRILQCVSAAASAGVMASADRFSSCVSFWCLAIVMGVLFFWSLTLCCLDLHSLMMRRNVHSRVLLIVICIGDWVMTFASLGVACAAAAVLDFVYKSAVCSWRFMPCNMYKISITLAFVACLFMAISSSVMFRLVASSF